MPVTPTLPVEAVLPELRQALAAHPCAVLKAPPGAGKSTAVPLALLDQSWLENQRVVMLAPRRLAARAAAARMADLLREQVGATVGYQVRLDRRIGPQTRIEVVTEGILTRRLQKDPQLAGVGLVIFDEFHERSLEGDLGLALCLELQGVLNAGLRILVMSATLDTGPVSQLLGGAPVIRCQGRSFPVDTRYLPPRRGQHRDQAVAAAIGRAAQAEQGSLLVFLPGAPEIRRVAAKLDRMDLGPAWQVRPLFGNLTRTQQQAAITPAPPGRSKIVLATSIAETSLTIEGIRVVVDGGLMRVPRFDVGSGMSRLVTLPVSRASADQRRGRAGRTAPGVCYRLWDPGLTLPEFNRPEILEADLAALVLELALWGIFDPQQLAWLDPPPAPAWSQALKLLKQLDLLDAKGRAAPHGRQVQGLPLHPRLAHMVQKAQTEGAGAAACALAALLTETDPLHQTPGMRDSDLQLRMDLLQDLQRGPWGNSPDYTVRSGVARRIERVARELRGSLPAGPREQGRASLGRLAAWAYPDRIARRRPGREGRYRMANGRGAFLDPAEPLAAREFIVAAELDGDRREARIFRAAAYDAATLEDQYGENCRRESVVAWDDRRQRVTAVARLVLGSLEIDHRPLDDPDPEKVREAFITGIRRAGPDCLPWTKALRQWRARAIFVGRMKRSGEEPWPDFSDPGLMSDLEEWLAPFLFGINKLKDLSRIDLKSALAGRLSWEQRQQLESWAPTHLTVPSGSRIPIDYQGHRPVLAVRLQEMFGLTRTPAIAGGRQPLLVHLLSPASRPVQITEDLAGFWSGSYREVKKEMQGRYPKHYWPENPLKAAPTRRSKPGK